MDDMIFDFDDENSDVIYFYAVRYNEEFDLDFGSFDYDEALKMAAKRDSDFFEIAVVDGGFTKNSQEQTKDAYVIDVIPVDPEEPNPDELKEVDGLQYIVIKRNGNDDGLVYDRVLCDTRLEAERIFFHNDTLLVCDANAVYYADNFGGWSCDEPLEIIER